MSNSLAGIKQIVDSGYNITFTEDSAVFEHADTAEVIVLPRSQHDGMWYADIHTLEGLGLRDTIHQQSHSAPTLACSAQLSIQSKSVRQRVMDLHTRMAHASCVSMCNAVGGDHPTWKNSHLSVADIRQVFRQEPCLTCVLAKRNLDPPYRALPEDRRTWLPGQCICMDPVPKISPVSLDGDVSFYAFCDMATGYLHCIPTRSTNAEAFLQALEQVRLFYQQHNCTVDTIRSDSEQALIGQMASKWLAEHHIKAESSAPYRHHQNGAERHIQTIIKGTSALLHGQPWLRADSWAEALRTYVQCRNRTPNSHTGSQSPHEVITKRITDLSTSFSFSFGDLVAVGVPKELRKWKFDLRNDLGIYVGQVEGSSSTHRIYNPYTHKVYDRGSVNKLNISEDQFIAFYNKQLSIHENKLPYRIVEDAVHSFMDDDDQAPDAEMAQQVMDTLDITSPITPSEAIPVISPPEQSPASSGASSLPPGMETRGRSKAAMNQFIPIEVVHAATAALRNEDTPTVKQALQREDAKQWKEAINKEVCSLLAGTLTPISPHELPSKCKIIHTTTQLKLKRNSVDAAPQKYKARTCARGDMLAGVFDQDEIYSPTVNSLTFAIVFQIAILQGMTRRAIDTVSAYLYQDYDFDNRPLAVKLERQVAEAADLDPNQLYKVNKYIYGLPDAGRAYYNAYSEVLTSNGYIKSMLDPCLFYRHSDTGGVIYIMIHVDDTYVCSSDAEELDRLDKVLKSRFEITTNIDADDYLGIHIEQVDAHTIKLSQPKLLQQLFSEFPDDGKSASKTAPMRVRTASSTTKNSKPMPRRQYLHVLGTLMYLTKSRPDIMAATSFASTRATEPTTEDYEDLLHVIGYLHNTKHLGLILRSRSSNTAVQPFQLYCHVDASYLVHWDSKSQTGYTLSLGDTGTFYAKSSKQQLVSTSSTHAETRALYTLVQDIKYIADLCKEISFPLHLPALVFVDNNPMKLMCTGEAVGVKKCKHFLMLIAYIREQVNEGLLEIRKVHTSQNVADILTKPVVGQDFQSKVEKLLGTVMM